MINRFLKRWGIQIVCISLISLFYLPLCGLMFQCGCTHVWAGDYQHCNIHKPGPPDCPFCSGPLYIQFMPYVAVCAASVIGIRIAGRFSKNRVLGAVAGLLFGLIAFFTIGWIFAIVWDYQLIKS